MTDDSNKKLFLAVSTGHSFKIVKVRITRVDAESIPDFHDENDRREHFNGLLPEDFAPTWEGALQAALRRTEKLISNSRRTLAMYEDDADRLQRMLEKDK